MSKRSLSLRAACGSHAF